MALRTLWSPTLAVMSLFLVGSEPPTSMRPARSAIGKTTTTTDRDRSSALARFPLRFEANAGQWDEHVEFVAQHGRSSLTLTDAGAVLTQGETSVRLTVAGGRKVKPVASGLLPTQSNYFVGDDESKFRTHVANYATVTYPHVLAGVDLVYRGEAGQIEYDFVVGKGASVRDIAMNVEGAGELSLSPEGDLLVHTEHGIMRQSRPRVFQRDAAGKPIDVASRYRLVGTHAVGFEVAAYDTTKDLVIDPTLAYADYLGGSANNVAEVAYGVAVDADGAAYVVGQSLSAGTNFLGKAGGFQPAPAGAGDGFVAKIAKDNTLVYTTYLGSSVADQIRGVALDADKNAYVVGYGASAYPTTAGAWTSAATGSNDIFVTKLSADGSQRLFQARIGGTGDDQGLAIAVDSEGAYITGSTNSANAFSTGDTQIHGVDAFVAKFAPDDGDLLYASYLGFTGNEYGYGIAVDSAHRAVVVGKTNKADFPALHSPKPCDASGDGFITRFDADASEGTYNFSGCIGGAADDIMRGVGIRGNRAYVVGDTASTLDGVPVSGPRDVILAAFNLDSGEQQLTTYLRGDATDQAGGIAVNPVNGDVFVTGFTNSSNFPTKFAYQAARSGSTNDMFVTKLDIDFGTYYSTYYGNSGTDQANAIALAPDGNVIVAGYTTNASTLMAANTTSFGTRGAAGNNDGVVFKLATAGPAIALQAPAVLPVPPKGSATLVLTGNGPIANPVLVSSPSGGALAGLVYTAGATGSVTDQVSATDAEGGTRLFDITVGPGITIDQQGPNPPPNGTIDFTAQGGKGAPYTWSLLANPSGGTITAAGSYKAGPTQAVDTVKVVDQLGNQATLDIAVGAAIAITPAAPSSAPRDVLDFTAAGGGGEPYTWTPVAMPSGGSITTDGHYTAGTTGGVTDRVKVTDSLDNEQTVDVTVTAGVTIAPATSSVNGGTLITFTATGGKAGAYTWTGQALPSGGSIGANNGLYSAGIRNNTVTDIVVATDSLGNEGIATVQVIGTDDQIPDAGTSSSSSSSGEITSSSSSGGSTSSSGQPSSSSSSSGTVTSSSSGEPASTSSSSSGADGSSGDAGGDDEGGGCSSSPTQDPSSAPVGLALGLGLAVMLRRRSRRS